MHPIVAAFHQGALVVSRPNLATLQVVGPDRTTWLQGMVTNDLSSLDAGRGIYTLVLDKKGKILTDATVVVAGDALLLAVPSSVAPMIHAHLDRYLVMEDAEVRMGDDPARWIQIVGPSADRVLAAARDADVSLVGSMVSCAGVGGALLRVREHSASRVVEACTRLPETVAVDIDVLDRLRPVLGWPGFPADFNQDCYPQEVGLDDRAISFNKGCYLGQEIVVKMRSRGHPARTLVRLLAACSQGCEAWPLGEPVVSTAGEFIGAITTAVRFGAEVVAFALVKWSAAKIGAEVLVRGGAARMAPAWGMLPGLDPQRI